MKIRSVIPLGFMVLLLCMNAVAEDKGSIQVPGVGSVVIPADTITIAVRAQSSINKLLKRQLRTTTCSIRQRMHSWQLA